MYVDGFVLPIPKKRRADYLKMARLGAKIWMDHGALQYMECEGDDVPVGKITSFTRAVKLQRGETSWFAFIVYKSRAHRDKVNTAVMKDKRMERFMKGKTVPFDPKRMIFGGFRAVVSR